MRFVCISDTHEHHREIAMPEGDFAVCAGDISMVGDLPEVADFVRWFAALPHRHKVFIAGNHDFCFEREAAAARAMVAAEGPGVVYLEDSGATIEGLRFWGSPWQPWFYDWAFNLPRGAAIAEKWALIPDDTDVLLTHGPPLGILDLTPRGMAVGCEDLSVALQRVQPRLHVFGHIHRAHGTLDRNGTTYVNACSCNESYEARNPPVVVDV